MSVMFKFNRKIWWQFRTAQEVQTGLDGEAGGAGGGGQGGGQQRPAADTGAGGGLFTDHPGQGKWIMEDDPDEFIEGGAGGGQAAAPPVLPATGTDAGGGGAGAPEEFQMTTKTGLVFRGKDKDAVLQLALEAIDRQAVTVTQHRAEVANLKRQFEGSGRKIDAQGYIQRGGAPAVSRTDQPVQPRQAQPALEPNPNWNDTKFYETFAKNPREAMAAAVEDYFGGDPRGPLSTSHEVALQVRDRIEIADFLAQNQDFPQTMEASKMVLDRLEEDGAELTNYNMKVAFDKLVGEGLLAKIEGTHVTEVSGDRGTTRTFVQPPPAPAPSRGASATPAPGNTQASSPASSDVPSFQEFEQWPWQKQQEFLKSKGMYHG